MQIKSAGDKGLDAEGEEGDFVGVTCDGEEDDDADPDSSEDDSANFDLEDYIEKHNERVTSSQVLEGNVGASKKDGSDESEIK